MTRENPATKALLAKTVIAATTLTPRIVNALVYARAGRGDRLEQLERASDACLRLQERIVLAQLAVKRDRRGEAANQESEHVQQDS